MRRGRGKQGRKSWKREGTEKGIQGKHEGPAYLKKLAKAQKKEGLVRGGGGESERPGGVGGPCGFGRRETSTKKGERGYPKLVPPCKPAIRT